MAVAAVVSGQDKVRADFAGFGSAESDIVGEGGLPVTLGLKLVTARVPDAGKTAVRAGLVPWRASLGYEPRGPWRGVRARCRRHLSGREPRRGS
jgi:hypothetical protein